MSNCHNTITIISQNVDDLSHLVDNQILEYFPINLSHRSNTKIMGEFVSHWTPPLNWLRDLLNQYPGCWIKNAWITDAGAEGLWIGCIVNSEIVIQNMEWQMPQQNDLA